MSQRMHACVYAYTNGRSRVREVASTHRAPVRFYPMGKRIYASSFRAVPYAYGLLACFPACSLDRLIQFHHNVVTSPSPSFPDSRRMNSGKKEGIRNIFPYLGGRMVRFEFVFPIIRVSFLFSECF